MAINKHVSIRPFTVIGYDCVHLPRMDGGCVIAAGWKQCFFSCVRGCPVVTGLVCVEEVAGEAGWIDGTAAGPTQL